jgi:hypothetical protein
LSTWYNCFVPISIAPPLPHFPPIIISYRAFSADFPLSLLDGIEIFWKFVCASSLVWYCLAVTGKEDLHFLKKVRARKGPEVA